MSEIVVIRSGELEAAVAVDFGNNLFSLKADGCEILWTPAPIERWRTFDLRTMPMGGIPLLAPWANRISGDGYFANGSRYVLNRDLGILWRDGNGLPIHGLLAFAGAWRVIARTESSVKSRLEFWRNPKWMAQFPFAHAIEMTHRVAESSLEIETVVENLSSEPMPLCIGFHPYFSTGDTPREKWSVRIPARENVVLSDRLLPTGQLSARDPQEVVGLAGKTLDHVFCGLTGEEFVAESGSRRIAVKMGPKFPVAVVYAPGDPLLSFEPMTALTDAFNLDQAGVDAKLQHVAAGAEWRESFWINTKKNSEARSPKKKPESRSQKTE